MLRGHLASAVSLVRNGLTILHADNDRSGDAQLVPFDAVATLFDRLELQVIGVSFSSSLDVLVHRPAVQRHYS